ncbi:MAG: DEAD/DEAH box helicase [Solirubrobacteraceae bacterium]|nr:DEAD/DEAH box helicase [Solirubrobacteraceae bacterium]
MEDDERRAAPPGDGRPVGAPGDGDGAARPGGPAVDRGRASEPWAGDAYVDEDGPVPRLAVRTHRGVAPTVLDDATPVDRDGPLPIHRLPFDRGGVAVLDRLAGLTVDVPVMLAAAELRQGGRPAAATIRAGSDERGEPRLELLPGWSVRAHAAFAAMPEAGSLEEGHRSGHREGDAPADPDTRLAVPADPSLVPRLDALLRDHPTVDLTPAARDRIATLRALHAERDDLIRLSGASRAGRLRRTRSGADLRVGGELLPFQWAGVRYLLQRRRSFLADEQGLGKTVQALVAFEVDDAWPAVVVCPASLKLGWAREAAHWLPHRTVAVLRGRGGGQWTATATASAVPAAPTAAHASATPPATAATTATPTAPPGEADLVVLNYELLEAHHDRLAALRPGAVAFDESHLCKEPRARRTKAAIRLAGTVRRDGLRLALTGTPVLNQPRELTTQLRLVDRLRDFGSGAELARRFQGDEAHDRLHWHLRASGFVRRLKSDVLPQLPAKRRVTLPIELDDPTDYRLAEEDVIAWLQTLPLDLDEIDARVSAALRAEQLVRMNHLRRLAAIGKLPAALEWIEDFLASGEPLVVFAQHREVQRAVLARFPGAAHVLGDDDAATRDAQIRRFQEGRPSPGHRRGLRAVDAVAPPAAADGLIVCSMRAAGQGITLTRASNVCFLELDWTPALHDQAEDRCHRIGQDDAVTAWYLLAPDTIDDDLATVLEHKRRVIDAVVDGHAPEGESVSRAVVRRLRTRTVRGPAGAGARGA